MRALLSESEAISKETFATKTQSAPMVKLDTIQAANEVTMSHSRDLVLTDN